MLTIIVTDTTTFTTALRVEVTPGEAVAERRRLRVLLSDRYALMTVPA